MEERIPEEEGRAPIAHGMERRGPGNSPSIALPRPGSSVARGLHPFTATDIVGDPEPKKANGKQRNLRQFTASKDSKNRKELHKKMETEIKNSTEKNRNRWEVSEELVLSGTRPSQVWIEVQVSINEGGSRLIAAQDLINREFQTSSVSEAFQDLTGVQQGISLMILNQLLPSMSDQFNNMSTIPLESFKTYSDISNFIEAITKSGLAANIDRSVGFILGNTGVGKSSLASTLKAFVDKPSNAPTSVLADHKNKLIETQILEVIDGVNMEHEKKLGIKINPASSHKVMLIDFIENEESEEKELRKNGLNIKLLDMGGHHEYFTCSTLFLAHSGFFLVCFNSAALSLRSLKSHYYSSVGTYIDLVHFTTAKARIRPKLALVATQIDKADVEETFYEDILCMTKEHLDFLAESGEENSVSHKVIGNLF